MRGDNSVKSDVIEESTREYQGHTFLSETEKDILRQDAKRMGLTQSAYIRHLILAARNGLRGDRLGSDRGGLGVGRNNKIEGAA